MLQLIKQKSLKSQWKLGFDERQKLIDAKKMERAAKDKARRVALKEKRSSLLKTSLQQQNEKRQTNAHKLKPVKFVETPVGHYLYVYAPIHYHLLIEYASSTTRSERKSITYQMIDDMVVNCADDCLRTIRFRNAMILYRMYGKRVVRKAGWSLKDAVYFAKNSYFIHKAMKCIGDS